MTTRNTTMRPFISGMKEETEKLPELLDPAVKAIFSFAEMGVEKAMSACNKSYFTIEFN